MIGNSWLSGFMEHSASSDSNLVISRSLVASFTRLPFPLFLLDSQRHILLANSPALEFFGQTRFEEVIGRHACHFLGCAETLSTPNACNDQVGCAECRLDKALANSTRSGTTLFWSPCAESPHRQARRHLRLHAVPLGENPSQGQVLAIFDASQEVLRMTLESIFLHDVRNALSSASYLVDMLLEDGLAEAPEILPILRASLFASIESVKKQQHLLRLETKQITAAFTRIDGYALLQEIVSEYGRHPVAAGKHVFLTGHSPLTLVTDQALLKRSLVNLLMNALEATGPGGGIHVGIRDEDGSVRIWVRNQSVIAEEMQRHIFEQYHSTKGIGRGLGTYCVKLLAEHYLQATVGFSSNARDGTEFWILMPNTLV